MTLWQRRCVVVKRFVLWPVHVCVGPPLCQLSANSSACEEARWPPVTSVMPWHTCSVVLQVSRTHTFGRIGTHPLGDDFDEHYNSMLLNTEPINWRERDVTFLLQQSYDAQLNSWLDNAEVFNGTLEQLQAYCAVDQPDDTEHTGDLVYKYPAGTAGWENTAKFLKPMLGDVREGTPRGSYRGHAIVRCRGRRLFLRAS